MSALHILNKTSDYPRFSECLENMARQDVLLLTESAVTALTDRDILWPESIMVYALEADIASRGLSSTSLCIPAKPIDFNRFVTLTLEADKVVSW